MNQKIFIVLHTLSVGGAERHASSIANFLSEHGYIVEIVLLDDNKVAYKLSQNVKVVSFSEMTFPDKISIFKPTASKVLRLKIYKRLSPSKYRYLERYLYYVSKYTSKLEYYFKKQSGIQKSIVISFMPIPNLSTAIVKQKLKYTLVLGEFNSPHLEFASDAPENQMKREYFLDADGFVFQTEEQKEFYSYLTNVKKVIIPNPIEKIEVEPFSGIRKKEIVNFCRLSKAKNLPLLIKSFTKLNQLYPEYKLSIYGEGALKEYLEKQIIKNKIENVAFIKPFSDKVLELVRESAMFVSSSDREGISNSMIEAMAIGLPVICTDCPAGGARMLIKPYENGILVPEKDSESLFQAMNYMIENPEQAEKMGRNAIAIRDTLEKEKILGQWLEFINSLKEINT